MKRATLLTIIFLTLLSSMFFTVMTVKTNFEQLGALEQLSTLEKLSTKMNHDNIENTINKGSEKNIEVLLAKYKEKENQLDDKSKIYFANLIFSSSLMVIASIPFFYKQAKKDIEHKKRS